MRIIIVGAEGSCNSLAEGLAEDGHDVSVIGYYKDRINGSNLRIRYVGALEFDNTKLIEAGIKNTDALFAITPNDNVNMTVALIAERIYHTPKVIARLNNPYQDDVYHKLGIRIISPVKSELELLKNSL